MIPNVAAASPAGFTRTSSGLVRAVSTVDTMLYCFMQIGISYVALIIGFWALYPQASMELATLVTSIGAASLGLVYGLLSAVYPRSGGDYVFLTRTVHPAIGMAASFSITFWSTFYISINGTFLSTFCLAPFFSAEGLLLKNTALTNLGTFFGSRVGYFVVGVFAVLFFGLALYRGMKTYFAVQRWAILIGTVSLVSTFVVLALGATGHLNFQNNFDQLVGPGTYAKVIADGQAAGASQGSNFTLAGTSYFMIWPAFALLFAVMSVSFGGEIRNVKRGQLIAISAAIAIGGALLIALEYFSRLAIGDDFLKSASYLSLGGSPQKLPIPNSWSMLLTSILANNPWVTILINVWFVFWTAFAVGVPAIYSSRSVLAWSLDGMAPAKLSQVSSRYHTPTYAILTCVILTLVVLVVYSFTNLLVILSGLAGEALVFLIIAISAIFFPYTKRGRAVYEGSPAKREIAGIPIITIAGIVATLFLAYLIFRVFVDATYGANTPFSIVSVVVILAVGFVWFYVARWVRRRQGVDVDLRFKEIPIE